MAMWLYEMSQGDWPPNNYRLDIWQNERWKWLVGRVVGYEPTPAPGDTAVSFYTPSGGSEPGF